MPQKPGSPSIKPYTLHLGDCFDVMHNIPDESIDAIVMDPPYPKKYLHLFGKIACEGRRVLKRGGSLLSIIPHYAAPTVLADIGEHLKWRWVISMWQGSGSHARMAMGVEVMWKPIGWWVKDAWPQKRGFIKDGFINNPPDKSIHRWEQSLDWGVYCSKFIPSGGTVLDPLMGTGTMGVACAMADLSFIGIDHDEVAFRVAEKKVSDAYALIPPVV